MVQEELDILNILAKNPLTSQRQIARQTGISLGQVNFLLKKFTNKGLIKMEGQTPKSLQYHLTPTGMATVADKTLRYMKASYTAVREVIDRVIGLGRTYHEEGYAIHVVGSPDEMMELCLLALNDGMLPYHVGPPEEGSQKAVIFFWEREIEGQYVGFTCLNLLKEQR